MSPQIIGIYDMQEEAQSEEEAKPVHIYYLCDRADGRPRYVGQTTDPRNRLRSHWALRGATTSYWWVRNLREAGRQLRLCVVEIVSPGEAASAELRWMRMFWDGGENLLNRHGLEKRRSERSTQCLTQ